VAAVAPALFSTLSRALEALGSRAAFPTPEEIDEALAPLAGVRFVRQKPVPRRRRAPRDPSSMYDAQIVGAGRVPTRPGSWHDLMNALVWATFPRAKRALHARQVGLVVVAPPGTSMRRSREADALALVDEGGVLLVRGEPAAGADAPAAARNVVFGHAIYELVATGRAGERPEGLGGAGLELAPEPGRELEEGLDAALAAFLEDRANLRDPSELTRIFIGGPAHA